MEKINISKEELEDLYLNQKLSTRDIAKHFNVGQTTVRRKMSKYNIQSRSSVEGKKTELALAKKQQCAERYKIEYLERSREKGTRFTKICPQCGCEFETTKSYEKKFCSRECASKNKIGKTFKHGKEIAARPRVCKDCGKQLQTRGAKYCPECLHIRKTTKRRIKTTCGYCGKEIEVIPSVFKQNQKNYCNAECMANDYSRRFSGENSPSWKGGKRHYQGHWLKQRTFARERDNFKCQLCGITEKETNVQMDVHHICNYRNFTDKEEANKLENLVCLCHKCHSFVHSNSNTNNLFIRNKI